MFERKKIEKKSTKKKSIIKIILGISIIIGFIFYNSYSNFISKKFIKKDSLIKIESGDTFNSIANKLGINTNYSKIYLKLNKPNFVLQKGDYEIKSNSTFKEIIKQFQKPVNKDERITILEGWNIYDIDNYLTNKGLIKKGEFENNWGIYEGLFYPDTYNINPNNFKLENFIKKMMNNFDKKVRTKLPEKITSNKEKLEKLLILASIVEKEANSRDNPEEIAIIAGILQKRIDENWFIGADATACYPHKITHKQCTPNFINKHIYDDNKYNLRQNLGLPPTPIGNPSFKTINATLNYKKSPYYFYLHDNNGKIHYAKNNEEHIINKNRYIKK